MWLVLQTCKTEFHSIGTWTLSYKTFFGVNWSYAEISTYQSSHVTSVRLSRWLKFQRSFNWRRKKFYRIRSCSHQYWMCSINYWVFHAFFTLSKQFKAVNKSRRLWVIFRNTNNRTRAGLVGGANATAVLCQPQSFTFISITFEFKLE